MKRRLVEQYNASGGRLFAIDADGCNLRYLPVMDEITGHAPRAAREAQKC